MRRPSGSCSSVAMPCRGQEGTGFSHWGCREWAGVGLPSRCSHLLTEVSPLSGQDLQTSHIYCALARKHMDTPHLFSYLIVLSILGLVLQLPFIECLAYARHSTQHFMYSISFNSDINPVRQVLLYLDDEPGLVTFPRSHGQLEAKLRFEPRSGQTSKPVFFLFFFCCPPSSCLFHCPGDSGLF